MIDTGSTRRSSHPSLRRPPATGNDGYAQVSQQIGGLPRHPQGAKPMDVAGPPPAGDSQDRLSRHPRGPADRNTPTTPGPGNHDGQVPRHPRGAASRQPAGPPDAVVSGEGVHHGSRGSDGQGPRREHQAGGGPSRVHHHLRGGTDTEAAVPSVDALRPYALALVGLAIEVRADGLALSPGSRSHGPIGKGGGRCAA
jgi:hypothetical protein